MLQASHERSLRGLPRLSDVLNGLPGARLPAFALAIVWTVAAMVVAVRQALDYTSTARAVAVCVLGWIISLSFAIVLGVLFGPTLSGLP